MADFNLKDDLLGYGRSQLKYMLLHNTTLAGLTAYTHKKGLFYYDTALDSIEFIKNNTTGWHSVINTISSNNPSYVSDNDVEDRLVMGSKFYATVTGYNPGFEGFVKVDADGYPSNQAKILFEDIETTDYTTVISSPGVDTRFATEKAIVDYVSAATFSAQDNILDWDGTKYLPFAAKKGSDPGYAYFYSATTIPSFVNNRVTLDGSLYARGLHTRITSNTGESLSGDGSILLLDANNVFTISTNGNETSIYGLKSGVKTPIYIGQTSLLTDDGLVINPNTNLFDINLTTIKLSKGTALKYLYLDASKNITYVDAPAGGVTPVDNILDWDTNAYKPFTSKTASAFYTGVTVPDAVATILNYDGIFRATQLFEGSTRVMTTHGNWAANGSLHAVTTSSHAGFCPQLPATATGTFLRDDGTWGSILWKRVGTTLSPFTSNDRIQYTTNSTSSGLYVTNSSSGIGIWGEASSSTGVYGSSTSAAGVVGASISSIGGNFSVTPSSTNTFVEVMRIVRNSSGTAATGLGGYESFYGKIPGGTVIESGRFGFLWTDTSVGAENSSFEWWLRSSGTPTKRMELTHAGQLIVPNAKLTGLATYADNTAATGGGLVAGELYRTAAGNVMITY